MYSYTASSVSTFTCSALLDSGACTFTTSPTAVRAHVTRSGHGVPGGAPSDSTGSRPAISTPSRRSLASRTAGS